MLFEIDWRLAGDEVGDVDDEGAREAEDEHEGQAEGVLRARGCWTAFAFVAAVLRY